MEWWYEGGKFTRRSFLTLASSIGVGLALPPDMARSLSAAATAPLMIKGANIAPKRSQFSPAEQVWGNFWYEWDWDWIRGNIARARDRGANSIRLIGSFSVVAKRRIPLSLYLDRQAQFAVHCRSLGLKCYLCGGDLRDVGDLRLSGVQDFLVSQALNLDRFRDCVIGFDLVNEYASGFSALGRRPVERMLIATINEMKRVGVGIRLTASDDRPAPSSVTSLPSIAGYLDFWDYHVYSRDVPYDYFLKLARLTGKAIVVGEFGAPVSIGSHPVDRRGFYKKILAVEKSHPLVVGSFLWNVVSDDFGMYDEKTLSLRDDIASVWSDFPG